MRHQRTGDAVFGGFKGDENHKPQKYVYKLIETLLPKANYRENQGFRLMELYSIPGTKRKGWIHLEEIDH